MSDTTVQKISCRRFAGFAALELLIVVLIIAILAVFTMMAFSGRRAYHADQQAYLLLDALAEARQRAVTQRETIRLEVGLEKREIRLINENAGGDPLDDRLIRRIPLAMARDLIYDVRPANIAGDPVEPTPVPLADFRASLHPLSQSETVATLRFLKNGNVVDAGSNAVGDNSNLTGATFYFWQPRPAPDGTATGDGRVIRAVTVLGSSGAAGYWKCPVLNGQCTDWIR